MSDCNPPKNIREAIEQNAMGPREARRADESASQHSLGDQIKAAQFLADEEVAKSKSLGLRFARFRPPGGGS
jgi:hypothetical protein